MILPPLAHASFQDTDRTAGYSIPPMQYPSAQARPRFQTMAVLAILLAAFALVVLLAG